MAYVCAPLLFLPSSTLPPCTASLTLLPPSLSFSLYCVSFSCCSGPRSSPPPPFPQRPELPGDHRRPPGAIRQHRRSLTATRGGREGSGGVGGGTGEDGEPEGDSRGANGVSEGVGLMRICWGREKGEARREGERKIVSIHEASLSAFAQCYDKVYSTYRPTPYISSRRHFHHVAITPPSTSCVPCFGKRPAPPSTINLAFLPPHDINEAFNQASLARYFADFGQMTALQRHECKSRKGRKEAGKGNRGSQVQGQRQRNSKLIDVQRRQNGGGE
jgi:hypothetical protein